MTDIEIKLERAEGDPIFSGRVLVGLNGAWGTICGERGWDLRDAHVVCRQLGYFGAVSAKNDDKYGLWSGRVWLRSLSCTGKEKSLLNCSNDGWGRSQNAYTVSYCNLNRMASVTCNGENYIAATVVYNNCTSTVTSIFVDMSKTFLET